MTFKDEKEGGSGNCAIVRSTMPQGKEATEYGVHLSLLAKQARNLIRDLNPNNDLTFLRITCKKHEMMIAPDKDYFLIVIQKQEDEVKEVPVPQPPQ